jgi:hypothetical protein
MTWKITMNLSSYNFGLKHGKAKNALQKMPPRFLFKTLPKCHVV